MENTVVNDLIKVNEKKLKDMGEPFGSVKSLKSDIRVISGRMPYTKYGDGLSNGDIIVNTTAISETSTHLFFYGYTAHIKDNQVVANKYDVGYNSLK